MPRTITETQWATFDFYHMEKGWTQAAAMKAAGIKHRATVAKHYELLGKKEYETLREKKTERRALTRATAIPEPKAFRDLSNHAQEGFNDFDYFRYYYLGRDPVPWQKHAADRMVELLSTDNREYAVVNVPPGLGKTTLFTHDIPCWLIVRNRNIRMLLGHRVHVMANQYIRRLKVTLERPDAMPGAMASIAASYGRFKPLSADLWRASEFIVEQLEGTVGIEKEPTAMGAGQDTGFLGGRFDFVIWDDLIGRRNTRLQERREEWQQWFTQEAETRLEPGGLFVLQGQRIGPDDGYRFCLDKEKVLTDEDEQDVDSDTIPKKYHHIIYPAHFDDICEERHTRYTQATWPKGCLLDHKRLSYKELMQKKRDDPRIFEISYQQADIDPAGQLVTWEELWGGVDRFTGAYLPGCFDVGRSTLELPDDVGGQLLSVITVDPSPSRYWAIQWWLYDHESKKRYLMDQHRSFLRADQFLDRRGNAYFGLAEDWVKRARSLGHPVSHIIIEANAAQKFMLQYDFFRNWLAKSGLSAIPHQTYANKSDPEYGVQTIASAYRQGLVRLPWKPGYGRNMTMALVNEVTKWPEGATDDCVMAQWFFEFHLPSLQFHFKDRIKMRVPTWAGKTGIQ